MNTVKLGSLRLLPSVLGLAATVGLMGTTTGCIIVSDHDDDRVVIVDDPPVSEPMLVTIDSDAFLESDAGEGVGVFVEYSAGGLWRFWTTCDTNYSGHICTFDLFATVDTASTIDSVQNEETEGYDYVEIDKAGGLLLHAETSGDYDGVSFFTTPGAVVRLEANVDGRPRPGYVYWFGNGVLHEGAPTSPVDFQPSKP